MRKISLLILTALCFRGWLGAADSSSVDVVMTIQVLGFYWVESPGDANEHVTVNIDQNAVDARRVIQSDANCQQDYSIRVASQDASPAWTLIETAAALGQNQYRLRGIWAVNNATITANSFGTNDIITGTPQTSSATQFFAEGESSGDVGTSDADGGFSVYPGQYSNIYILVEGAPSPLSAAGPLTSVLEITMTATP
ncbi:MAG: hypothetical protein A3A86_05485 [Elusimicrobia bacterium RIFCSPLOWO2_01_FULL_60_11]|nr:MAG: hypothetical protein A3A86_05485 [Elusimicrobia bacterium RIFCSPLOWO2_01_FULL_60_11]